MWSRVDESSTGSEHPPDDGSAAASRETLGHGGVGSSSDNAGRPQIQRDYRYSEQHQHQHDQAQQHDDQQRQERRNHQQQQQQQQQQQRQQHQHPHHGRQHELFFGQSGRRDVGSSTAESAGDQQFEVGVDLEQRRRDQERQRWQMQQVFDAADDDRRNNMHSQGLRRLQHPSQEQQHHPLHRTRDFHADDRSPRQVSMASPSGDIAHANIGSVEARSGPLIRDRDAPFEHLSPPPPSISSHASTAVPISHHMPGVGSAANNSFAPYESTSAGAGESGASLLSMPTRTTRMGTDQRSDRDTGRGGAVDSGFASLLPSVLAAGVTASRRGQWEDDHLHGASALGASGGGGSRLPPVSMLLGSVAARGSPLTVEPAPSPAVPARGGGEDQHAGVWAGGVGDGRTRSTSSSSLSEARAGRTQHQLPGSTLLMYPQHHTSTPRGPRASGGSGGNSDSSAQHQLSSVPPGRIAHQQQKSLHISAHPAASMYPLGSPITGERAPTVTVPVTSAGAGMAGTRAHVGSADNVHVHSVPPEPLGASRKRPRSASLGAVALGSVSPGAGVRGRPGFARTYDQAPAGDVGGGNRGNPYGHDPLGRCHTEGCSDAAEIGIDDAHPNLKKGRYCRQHAGLSALFSQTRSGVFPTGPRQTSRPAGLDASASSAPPSATAQPLLAVPCLAAGARQPSPMQRQQLRRSSVTASTPTTGISTVSQGKSGRGGGRGDGRSGGGRGGDAASAAATRGEGRAGTETGGGSSSGSGRKRAGGATTTGLKGGGKCEIPDCGTQPRYAASGATRPQFCGLHKLPGQVNIVSRCCKHVNCSKVPHFGNNRERPMYCGEHKLEGMVNVANRRCEDPDCQRQPTYGNQGDKRPRFCSTHKHPGMYDVIARRCEHDRCMTRAAFNFHGEKAVKYCAAHKLEGMENLKSKCCEVEGCKKYRVYGFDGEPAVCCASHKREGMVDVRSSRCEYPDCFRHPSFGHKWERKRRFCGRHKLAGMMDVRSRKQPPQKKRTPQRGAMAKRSKTTKPSPLETSATTSSSSPGQRGGSTRRRPNPLATDVTSASTTDAAATAAAAAVSSDTAREATSGEIEGRSAGYTSVARASRGCSDRGGGSDENFGGATADRSADDDRQAGGGDRRLAESPERGKRRAAEESSDNPDNA